MQSFIQALGLFWWIQSLYVRPAFRRRGVVKRPPHFHLGDSAACAAVSVTPASGCALLTPVRASIVRGPSTPLIVVLATSHEPLVNPEAPPGACLLAGTAEGTKPLVAYSAAGLNPARFWPARRQIALRRAEANMTSAPAEEDFATLSADRLTTRIAEAGTVSYWLEGLAAFKAWLGLIRHLVAIIL